MPNSIMLHYQLLTDYNNNDNRIELRLFSNKSKNMHEKIKGDQTNATRS